MVFFLFFNFVTWYINMKRRETHARLSILERMRGDGCTDEVSSGLEAFAELKPLNVQMRYTQPENGLSFSSYSTCRCVCVFCFGVSAAAASCCNCSILPMGINVGEVIVFLNRHTSRPITLPHLLKPHVYKRLLVHCISV